MPSCRVSSLWAAEAAAGAGGGWSRRGSLLDGRWGWLAVVILGLAAGAAPLRAEPVLNPANGHYYEAVSQSQGIGWSAARSAASRETFKGMPGHLVTIGSAQENRFLVDQFPQAVRGYFWL